MAEAAPDQHIEQHGHAQQGATPQPAAAPAFVGQQQAENIVDQAQAQQEQQGLQALEGPEEQRGRQQQHGQPVPVFCGGHPPEPDEDGQKEAEEGEGREQHTKNLPARRISRRPPREE